MMTSAGGVFMRRLAWLVFSVVCVAAYAAGERTVLVVGDSLSAAFGIDARAGWVTQLEQRVRESGHDYKVINASISGDTTASGLARLPALLATHKPAVVIIELGGNDGLRGLSLDQMRHNLTRMAARAKASGARVLLVGVDLPPNYGTRYTDRFRRIYQDTARSQQVVLVPSILTGVGGQQALMQADGIHPTAAAQTRMLDNVWPALQPLL
jgi:acyl-CoA thioesterase-1